MSDTDEQIKAKVAGLLEERRGYLARGLTDRVAAVDAELKRLGSAGSPPAKRATRRTKKEA